jgi:hypothetical protein
MRPVLMASAIRTPLTFDPPPGAYGATGAGHVAFKVNASEPVQWFWGSTGNLPNCDVANGGIASSITFSFLAPRGTEKQCDIDLNVGASAWAISLDANNTL